MQKQTERCHPIETRPLTIREYARVQSFPDSWVFTGSTSSKYRQIGNAVPVKLAEAVALSVKHSLILCKVENIRFYQCNYIYILLTMLFKSSTLSRKTFSTSFESLTS